MSYEIGQEIRICLWVSDCNLSNVYGWAFPGPGEVLPDCAYTFWAKVTGFEIAGTIPVEIHEVPNPHFEFLLGVPLELPLKSIEPPELPNDADSTVTRGASR